MQADGNEEAESQGRYVEKPFSQDKANIEEKIGGREGAGEEA